ncbi:unnamed protein product [Effrenium voratum]|nr:unnamed protein product [Effrenium voratum]
MSFALGNLVPLQNSTAAGITIESKESDEDGHGKKRLALTITTKTSKSKKVQAQSDRTGPVNFGLVALMGPTGAAELPEAAEHCVITDGTVTFSSVHFIVLFLMVFPVALVLVLILCCNSGTISDLCLGVGRRLPPQMRLPSATRLRRTEANLGATCTPPAAVTVLLVLLMVLMKINVTSVLTTAHVIIERLQRSGALSDCRSCSWGRRPCQQRVWRRV